VDSIKARMEEIEKIKNTDRYATLVYDLVELLQVSNHQYQACVVGGENIIEETGDFILDVMIENPKLIKYILKNKQSIKEEHGYWGEFLIKITLGVLTKIQEFMENRD